MSAEGDTDRCPLCAWEDDGVDALPCPSGEIVGEALSSEAIPARWSSDPELANGEKSVFSLFSFAAEPKYAADQSSATMLFVGEVASSPGEKAGRMPKSFDAGSEA